MAAIAATEPWANKRDNFIEVPPSKQKDNQLETSPQDYHCRNISGLGKSLVFDKALNKVSEIEAWMASKISNYQYHATNVFCA